MDNLTNSIDQVVEENALPHEWSKEVLAELKDLGLKKNKRNDLRKVPFVTIDGKDAKDFDDAVFCEANKDCLLYTSPSPRDMSASRMPSSA